MLRSFPFFRARRSSFGPIVVAVSVTAGCAPPAPPSLAGAVHARGCDAPGTGTPTPAAGATVHIECPATTGPDAAQAFSMDLQVDANGSFEQKGIPPLADACDIVVRAPGAQPRHFAVADHCSDGRGRPRPGREPATPAPCSRLWIDATLLTTSAAANGGAQ